MNIKFGDGLFHRYHMGSSMVIYSILVHKPGLLPYILVYKSGLYIWAIFPSMISKLFQKVDFWVHFWRIYRVIWLLFYNWICIFQAMVSWRNKGLVFKYIIIMSMFYWAPLYISTFIIHVRSLAPEPDISDVGHLEKINDKVWRRVSTNPCWLDLGWNFIYNTLWTEGSHHIGLNKTLISFLSKIEISGSGAKLLMYDMLIYCWSYQSC